MPTAFTEARPVDISATAGAPHPTGKLPLLISLVVLIGLLGIYAAQTELGHWQVDEFRYFANHREAGWGAYFNRFYTSPRPLSELLIYAYGAAVLAFDRAFVPETLLLLWSGSLLAMVAAAWATVRRSPGRLLAAAALGIAPMILVMQISPVTEMFFWPVATVAYVPTAASLTALLFLLHEEPSLARQRWCGAALLAATLSHEIGAAFALSFAGVAALFIVMERRTGRDRITALWWLIPALAGGLVMLGLVLFRSQFVDLGADTKPYTGRLLASAAAAAWQLLVEFVTSTNWAHDPAGSFAAIVQKSAFACGFALIWLRWGQVRPNRWQVAIVVGLVGGAYFALLAAYYHYGDLCCERHSSIRQWLIELVYILAAVTVLGRWKRMLVARWAGPLLLVASLVPVIAQIPEIRADFAMIGMARQARVKTWRSGLTSGPQMEFYMPPDNSSLLIHGTSETVGTVDLGGGVFGPNELLNGIGAFFGKTLITVCQPWQTHQSFLIDGVFIPACPPHDGPPDLVFDTVPH